MSLIQALVMNGTVCWIAIVVLGLEFALMVTLGRGKRALGPLVANALSGTFLILALYGALAGSGPGIIALMLGFGFLAHLAELVLRLRNES